MSDQVGKVICPDVGFRIAAEPDIAAPGVATVPGEDAGPFGQPVGECRNRLTGFAAAAVFLLHCVDYIEHYGLERQRLPGEGGAGAGGARQPMPYEKVQPWHSWNANWAFTNACAFRLQRHSDHHAHAERSFEDLRDMPDAPQLPMSYPVRGRVGGEWVVGGVEGSCVRARAAQPVVAART